MKFAGMILLVLSLFSCNDVKKEDQNVNSEASIELMEGYFPKNDIEFNQPVKVITVANKKDFERYFGTAKTMTNIVSEIDFDKNKIVAIVAKPSEKKQTISIIDTELKKNKLAINYKLELGEPLSFTSSDLKMFKVPKSVYAINVYSDDKDKRTKTKN